MQVIIKGLHGFKVPDSLKDYAEEKIRKYEKMIEEPAICEIVFEDINGSQGGVDKKIHFNLELPNEKYTLHVEETTTDFMGSINLAQEKIEQEILRYKSQKKIGSRYPKKYYDAKIEEEKTGEE